MFISMSETFVLERSETHESEGKGTHGTQNLLFQAIWRGRKGLWLFLVRFRVFFHYSCGFAVLQNMYISLKTIDIYESQKYLKKHHLGKRPI